MRRVCSEVRSISLITKNSYETHQLQVYLLGLGIANSIYSQIYCRRDVQWRGSISCSVLGCLAVISVEASVFTLAIMAGFRLLVVHRLLK